LPPKFAGGPYATKSKVLVKSNDKVLPLKREEQIAYIFLQSMSNMEDDCGRDAAEPCTFEALLRGPKLKKDGWEVGRLAFDPNTADPNYSYKLTLSEGSWEIWANPRRPGVGGFYLKQKWGGGVWYNPAGPADRSHTLIDGGSIDGDLFVIK
jgi:hypothetical protein